MLGCCCLTSKVPSDTNELINIPFRSRNFEFIIQSSTNFGNIIERTSIHAINMYIADMNRTMVFDRRKANREICLFLLFLLLLAYDIAMCVLNRSVIAYIGAVLLSISLVLLIFSRIKMYRAIPERLNGFIEARKHNFSPLGLTWSIVAPDGFVVYLELHIGTYDPELAAAAAEANNSMYPLMDDTLMIQGGGFGHNLNMSYLPQGQPMYGAYYQQPNSHQPIYIMPQTQMVYMYPRQ